MSRNIRYEQRSSERQPEPWMEQLAWLMDEAIPLPGGWSVGLDALFGLIPGLGDLVSSAISSLIIVAAARSGLPRAAIMRMVMNVGIDTLVGSIPFVGDIFDVAYKSNVKNLEIYREHIRGQRSAAKDWLAIALTIAVLVGLAVTPIVALVFLVHWLQQFQPKWF